jgi:hypothetical protein
VILTENPNLAGEVTARWAPTGQDVTVRLERQDRDGGWHESDDAAETSVRAGATPEATWSDLPPGRYRAVLVRADGDCDSDRSTSDELVVPGSAATLSTVDRRERPVPPYGPHEDQ